MPYNIAADSFRTNKSTFIEFTATLRFWAPLKGFGATTLFILGLLKSVVYLIFATSYERISIGSRRFLKRLGEFGPKFQVEGDVPHQSFFASKKPDASAFHMV